MALVCGILLCLPFAGVPALIAGTVGRRRVREEPHGVGGANMALAGIVLGSLNLVLTALSIVYLIATLLSF